LDNPQKHVKFVHVAGTNGKGSTSKIINQILIEHFKTGTEKIGLFTSPHLFSYCERIKINNEDISEYVFNRLVNDIDSFARKNNVELTEFELLTVVAIYYFYIRKVDYAVMEVGLGGKYDATNIINPLIEVITAIYLDHTERLGDTVGKIALQKAGIIKENSVVVVSKNNKGFDVIEKIAKNQNSKLILANDDIKIIFDKDKNYAEIDNKKYEFNLLGDFQKENLALALAAAQNTGLDIKEEDIVSALKNVNWMFRMQYDKKTNVLTDGAHNPSGARVLRDFSDKYFKTDKKKFFFGCLKNKDYKTMFEILFKEKDEVYFCEFNHKNALKFEQIPLELKEKYNIKQAPGKDEFIKNNPDCLKIFCGSLYMLGEIFSKQN